MHLSISNYRGFVLILATICLAAFAGQAPLFAAEGPLKVVILGSSTAAGANATPLTESWANRFAANLSVSNPGSQVTNLAVGGFTTFNAMPTGNIPPGSWNLPAYLPSPGHNITTALALDPDLIIINLPTNDSDVQIPVDLQIANYATIVAAAAAADVPVWITTSQPRNTLAAAQSLIRAMVGATEEAFAGRSIDFWTGLADPSGDILAAFDSDGVHLNNAGHALLLDRIMTTVTYDRPAGPFVAMHPRARTVTENDSVSFRVISYGSGAVSYQWQRNGEDLTGETTSQLFLANASPADSGASFRCVITRDAEQVFSNEARLTVQSLPDPPSTLIVSDDFSTGTLDTGVWTFRDPKQDATLTFTGTGTADAWLTLAVPGGSSHDLWTNANEAPQILQPFSNQDFEIEVKFASTPDQKYQMQGLVVQKDSANLVRFDVVRQGTRAHLFAATFTDGLPSIKKDSTVNGAPPSYLRLKRAGNQWTGSFSYDGEIWTVVTAFAFSTVTTAGGVFAGNAGDTPAATPAFTAHIDYFMNTAAPVHPEDGPPPPVTLAPANGSTVQGIDVDLQWSSTGNEQDSVLLSTDTLTWDPPAIAATVASDTASLHLHGLVRGATYYWKVRSSRNGVWSAWSGVSDFATGPAVMLLRTSMNDTTATFAPDTTWADPAFARPGDWRYGSNVLIPVTVRTIYALPFSSCSLVVHWDPARLSWRGIDVVGSLSAVASATTANVDSAAGTVLFSATFPDTVTLFPDQSLLQVLLGVRTPGRSNVTADQFRFSASYGGAIVRSTATADTLTASVLLGDVASSGGIAVRADGKVDFDDLSAWSLGYWSTSSDTGLAADYYRRKFDIGPTVDGTPFSLPLPDGTINFEDLMIMASMYGTTGSTLVPKTGHQASVTIALSAGTEMVEGNTTVVPVLLSGNASDVHGLAIRLPGIGRRLIGIAPGSLLSSLTPSPLLFERIVGEDVEVNIATIGGNGRAIPMEGELLSIRLRSAGSLTPFLIDARDGQNQTFRTTGEGTALGTAPSSYALEQNYPNPFNPGTRIQFAVTERHMTTLQIFDVLGRQVATVLQEIKDPGTYTLTWDASGLPSGMYICRMVAGSFTATRRLMLVK